MLFDLRERLGAGYFGEVWLATDIGLNADRAVKLIPKDKLPDPNNFFREAQLLKAAEHPNIVRVETTGDYPDGRIFVAMEYLPKGSLDDEAKGAYVWMTRAKRIMIDVLRGLEWAHSKGILHHDIKPANILVGQANEGKLSDFGLAIQPAIDGKRVRAKDYNYVLHIAPEVDGRKDYSVRSDIYACGITLYRLVNGDSYLPQVDPADAPKLAKIGKYPDRTRYRAFVPRQLRTVINRAMSVDPDARFSSAEEMRRALEQISVLANWRESHASDHIRWIAGGDTCFEVVMRVRGSLWDVTVRKGSSKASLRQVSRLAKGGMDQPHALRYCSKILQRVVVAGTVDT